MPNKKRHAIKEDGSSKCNQEMITLIDKYSTIKQKPKDLTWEVLNELKI